MEEKQADDSGQMHIMSNGVSLRNRLQHCEMAKEVARSLQASWEGLQGLTC